MTARILVLGEGAGRAGDAAAALVERGYDVQVAPANAAGVEHVATFWPDLVLLSFEGPAREDLLAQVRGSSGAPLMVWAERCDNGDAIRALRQGADDYMNGSVEEEELAARVVAHLRRAKWRVRGKIL